jgi:transposase
MGSEIQKIKLLVSSLEKRVTNQNLIIEEQSEKIRHQSEKIESLSIEVEALKLENKGLKEKLHKKDSRNSSIPPSKDENRPKKNQSLRRASGRKTGGQKGHPGDTLKMTQTPDEIVKHIPVYCRKCGKELEGEAVFNQRRQVIDIPPIKTITTEYQVYSKSCSCGYCTLSEFPSKVKSPVSYGNNVEVLISYLSVRQYLSINRIQEFLAQVTNLKLSQGSICNKIKSFADKCSPIYSQIKQRIEQSKCIGTDETGYVENGKKGWMWTWQTPQLTYIVASSNRGTKTIKDNFENGFPMSTLVHDCWKPHFNIRAKDHQICLAHLRRELNFFIEQRKECWSYEFETLLRKALRVKSKINENPNQEYHYHIREIKKRADQLLNIKIYDRDNKLKSFQKRMIKYKNYLFPFLESIHIPPDNNGSERAIRNVKVKQKVSGQFKSKEGAERFAVIRSVIDTCLKNKANLFYSLSNIHILQPE